MSRPKTFNFSAKTRREWMPFRLVIVVSQAPGSRGCWGCSTTRKNSGGCAAPPGICAQHPYSIPDGRRGPFFFFCLSAQHPHREARTFFSCQLLSSAPPQHPWWEEDFFFCFSARLSTPSEKNHSEGTVVSSNLFSFINAHSLHQKSARNSAHWQR